MATRMYWKGDELKALVAKSVADGLNAGAVTLQNIMATKMSTRHNVVGKGGKSGKRNIYKSAPPGAYPGWRTGNLARSIGVRNATPSSLVSAAGVTKNLDKETDGAPVGTYALYLEFGTKRMAARPWAMRSLTENKPQILAAITGRAAATFKSGAMK